MKEEKILKRLKKGIENNRICLVYLKYMKEDEEPCPFLPLRKSDTLVLSVPEGDVEKNGYAIRRLEDYVKVKKTDTIIDSIKMKNIKKDHLDDIDLTDWKSAFASIGQEGRVVIVESELIQEKELNYAVGKIEKVGNHNIRISYYGPDKEWEGRKWKIPYELITRVTIGSRYTEVLTQYVPQRTSAEIVEEVEDMPGQKLVCADQEEA